MSAPSTPSVTTASRPSGLPAPAPLSEPFRPVASGSGLRRTNSDQRPSRPRRTASDQAIEFARGDQHWLSEDEGVEQVHNFLAHRPRRATRQPHPDRDEDDPGGHGDGGKAGGPSGKGVPSSLANGHTHRLHNRPSMVTAPTESPIGLPSATALLSFMLVALECPACRDTFSNPTTLACGHTVCHGCMIPEPSIASQPKVSAPPSPRPRSGSVSSSASRQRSPVMAATALLPDWLRRRSSTASETSSIDMPPVTAGIFGRGVASGHADLAAPARPTCPHPECHEVARAGPVPHPDVVLQKITAHFISRAPHKRPLRDRFGRMRIGDDTAAAIVIPPASPRKVRDDSTTSQHEVHRSKSGDSGDSGSGSGSGSVATIETELTETGKRLKRPPRIAAKRVRVPEEAVMLEVEDDEEGGSGENSGDVAEIEVDESDDPTRPGFAELVMEELECQVCTSIFVEPITTPCGHSFCRRCLIRSLDHSDKCPLCRSDMPSYAFFAHHALNHALAAFLEHPEAFRAISQHRLAMLKVEDHIGSPHVPVFVCSISWPGLPTFLHVFEPRYRLMMRRAMDSDRRFGMILPAMPGRGGGFHEYGTMLEIRKLDMLPDGRSVVETVGLYRFRVLEAGTLDGYSTAVVDRIEDITAEQEAQLERTELASLGSGPAPAGMAADEAIKWAIDRKSTVQLMADCRAFYDSLRDGLVTSWQYQRVNNTYGPMPTDPAEASFWFAQVLPIDDYQKAQLLPVTSPRLRLRLVVFWIEQLRAKWWYGNTAACVVMQSTSVRPATIALGATAAVAGAALGYCLYFDYQRRHNPAFRKALDRERVKVAKAAKLEQNRQRTASAESLKRAIALVANEPLPSGGAEEKEQYFLEQVAMGEQLVARGPEFYIPAAVQFFKALRVYPAPHELIMIYQKTQPPAVFNLIMDCLSTEKDAGSSSAPRSRTSSDSGAIIEEITDGSASSSSPRKPAGKKSSSQTGSSASSSPNGTTASSSYVEVAAPGEA